MKSEKLLELRNEVQNLFAEEEKVHVTVYDRPIKDEEHSIFSITIPFAHNTEGKAVVKKYMDRIVAYLEENGYEIENEYAASTSGSPIEGNVQAFKRSKNN